MFRKTTPWGFYVIISIFCIFLFGQGCVEYVSEPLPPQGQNTNSLLIIIHGLNSSPDDWPLDLQNAIDARISSGVRENWDIVRYDWEEYASVQSTAMGASLPLGKIVGTMLSAEEYNYEHIHFIAHCLGGRVAHGAATTYVARAAQPATIHMTYLDPAILGMALGSGANFSEDYFNTDDSSPATNNAAIYSHSFDVTNFMLRDVGTAEGHIWPINYYIQTVEDDRLLYGFQLSPMTNTTPVDFSQFPAGETTTLYDEVPTETVTLSTGPMDVPIRYTESTVISTFFDADRAAVENLLIGTPFELAVLNGDSTVIGLGCYEYRQSSIGYYIEAGIVIPVVKIGNPLPANWFTDMLKPPLDRKMGFYVLHIPATSPVAEAAGLEIWGFPKIHTNITFSHVDNTIDVTIDDPNSTETILNFSGTFGPMNVPTPASSSLLMTELNGSPMMTINHTSGTNNLNMGHDLVLTVGASSHVMAQNLRDIGVDMTSPTMVTVSTDYQSVLYYGEPM